MDAFEKLKEPQSRFGLQSNRAAERRGIKEADMSTTESAYRGRQKRPGNLKKPKLTKSAS
jgi:hypothetical protein